MELKIRKLATFIEEIIEEGGQILETPKKVVAAMAVIKNPYSGRPFKKDLSEMVNAFAPTIGEILGKKAVEVLGEPVEAYGKGALVGSDGEIEHGSALIHTLKFGNAFRGAAQGSSYLPSAEKRGGVGASIDIAIKHSQDLKVRSHHQTFEVRIPDAPRADEIVIICAVTNSGRPHPRSGSLQDELIGHGAK